MKKSSIKMGDRVEIVPHDRKNAESYASKVEQVIDESIAELHVPISYGNLIELPLNTPHVFTFYTDNGMMRTDAVIEKFFVVDGFKMMRIKMLNEAQKYQRREFFRFECSIHFHLGVLADAYDIARDRPKPEMHPALTRDISAGGVCFTSSIDAEVKARVKCQIPLGGDDFTTFGIVIHRQELREMHFKFMYRVMFMDLTASEKDRIVKYIFTEQRKALTRGIRV